MSEFYIVVVDITFIMWSCTGGGVLTTGRRRPSHRWGDSETHPPSAPYWCALATSRWAAHVWTRTAPSEGKEAGGRGSYSPNQMEKSWGKSEKKNGNNTLAYGSQTDNESNKWGEKNQRKWGAGNNKETWQEIPHWTKPAVVEKLE